MQRWLGVVPVLLLLMASHTAVTAQQATPTPEFMVAVPDLCQVEPLTIDELVAFVGTPSSGYSAPEPGEPPVGEPADPHTVAAITETAMELYACLNANEFMRAFALFTDEMLTRESMAGKLTDESIEAYNASTAPPLPDGAWWSISVEDVTVLDDGRVGATIVERNPQAQGDDNRIYVIFDQEDDEYLIDAVLQLAE